MVVYMLSAVGIKERKMYLEIRTIQIIYGSTTKRCEIGTVTVGRRAEKAVKKEGASREKMLVRELGSLLDQDSRKRESVRKLQRSEMIEQSELERETAVSVLQTAGIPLRVKAARVRVQVQRTAVNAVAGIAKYVALFGGVLLMPSHFAQAWIIMKISSRS
ncbi:MAG: hypothetical protein LUG99_21490, partial [Lachnospiraceae bacterium]|nr:hypothetical protein [Lachnospiraceae bacterium]